MNNEWITDRLPTDDDCKSGLYVVYNALGRLEHICTIKEGEAWKPLTECEPYVKPKRYTVTEVIDWCYKVIGNDYDRNVVATSIPTREAAERIAAIYEEVMP